MPFIPDILVVPSDLSPFAKPLPPLEVPPAPTSTSAAGEAVEGDKKGTSPVVVFNPGRLAKGVAGGTWAYVCIAPAASLSDVTPALDSKGSNFASRCRVDILNI